MICQIVSSHIVEFVCWTLDETCPDANVQLSEVSRSFRMTRARIRSSAHTRLCYRRIIDFAESALTPCETADCVSRDVRFNHITEVRPGTFHGLGQLSTLLLNDNRIRQLPAGAFDGAPNLRVLYLYKNRISRIVPGAFAGLSRLEQLYLHHNHLREIQPGTFNDLPALERLFLHNNRLHQLPADAFLNVGPMTRLRLDSNALVCDCNLAWLVERMRDRRSEMAAICQAPQEMKGRSLTTMTIDDFHCS